MFSDKKQSFIGIGLQNICARTRIFRKQLIREFRVIENGAVSKEVKSNAPKYNSKQLLDDDELFSDLLLEKPYSLIKFKIFKKTLNEAKAYHQDRVPTENKDKRLVRVKNIGTVPIGVWARWLLQLPVFQNTIVFFICANALMLGLELELDQSTQWEALNFLGYFDGICVIVFTYEIIIKWLDNFMDFWNDNWNIFDFIVTSLSTIPELVIQIIGAQGGAAATISKVGNQLRLFRTLRSLKVIARFRSLRVIVHTVMDAFKSMAYILLLLFIFMYIYAIFGINVFASYTYSSATGILYQNRFLNLWEAYVTLFQLLTLDQWYDMEKDARLYTPYDLSIVFYVSWVIIAAFIFQNIFVGVMVKNFQRTSTLMSHNENKKNEKIEMNKHWNELQIELEKALKESTENKEAEIGGSGFVPPQRKQTADGILVDDHLEALQWQQIINRALSALQAKKQTTTWPRDTLFKYLQTMEELQENMKEYNDIRYLASCSIFDMYDQ